jgi:hypothetical protein
MFNGDQFYLESNKNGSIRKIFINPNLPIFKTLVFLLQQKDK